MGNLGLARLKQILSQILTCIQIFQRTEKRQSGKIINRHFVVLKDTVLASQVLRQDGSRQGVPNVRDKAHRFTFYRAAKSIRQKVFSLVQTLLL